ncbi:SAV_2336 N-terminal domain-related protein, partial [Streptomyces sp. NPDC006356]
ALHAPEQLSDPTGRRVTLLLSDCAGPMWRSGQVQRLLHRWATTAPVAVVQPLPQRMWLRTHLPARRGVLHRREGPAGSLLFRPDKEPVAFGALPVPVLALRRESVEGWARLVSGATGQSLSAAAGWVRADHPASAAPVRAAQERSGADRVRAFWRPASSDARRLAVYLSAVPLYLPVMQLVQHAMLAGSGPDVLSEVLLSGLLRRREDADDPRAVRYDFLPGVATELRSRLSVDEVELLFKHCSEYVERKFGRSARNFPALAGAFLRGAVPPDAAPERLTGPGEREPAGLRAFAEVSAEVLRDLGARLPAVAGATVAGQSATELLDLGRQALARFNGEGLTRELDAAVEYSRRAVAVAGPGGERVTAGEELAQALLARWRVRRVGEDLREAWEALDEQPVTMRGRLVLGLVYWAQAQEVRGSGVEFDGLPQSLRDWARGEPGPAAERARDVLLYLADLDLGAVLADEDPEQTARARRSTAAEALTGVRRALGESGPYGPDWRVLHLHRAVDAASAWFQLSGSVRALVARGRLWLDLAREHEGYAPVADAAADAAASAAEDLMEAVRDETALPAADRCLIWLDVAAAIEIPPTEREESLLLYAVQQAERAAGDDPELRFECLVRAGRIYRDRHDQTGGLTELNRAVEAWEQAVRLLGEDDRRRPRTLADLGRALYVRFGLRAEPDDIARSVDHLRQAVEECPPDDPQLPWLRRSLGRAYYRRYLLAGVLTDLYEADWLFAEAVRGSENPWLLAQCRISRGNVARLLYERTSAVADLHKAVDFFSQAVEIAEEAGESELAAAALTERGRARNAMGRTYEARTDYDRALGLTDDRDRVRLLRALISRLSAETAAE